MANLKIEPTPPTSTYPVTISFYILNKPAGSTPPFKVLLNIFKAGAKGPAIFKQYFNVPALCDTCTRSGTLKASRLLPSGNYYATVVVDTKNNVPESSKFNNSKKISFSVFYPNSVKIGTQAVSPKTSHPQSNSKHFLANELPSDLAIINMTLYPLPKNLSHGGFPRVDMRTVTMAKIRNYGKHSVSKAEVNLLVQRTTYSHIVSNQTKIITDIGPNDTKIIGFDFYPRQAGWHSFKVSVKNSAGDPLSVNNHRRKNIYVYDPNLSDLVVCTINPQRFKAGERHAIIFFAKNYGPAPSPATIMRITVDGKDPVDRPIPPLDPGERSAAIARVIKFDVLKDHEAEAIIDPESHINEYTKKNNKIRSHIYVYYKYAPAAGHLECTAPF